MIMDQPYYVAVYVDVMTSNLLLDLRLGQLEVVGADESQDRRQLLRDPAAMRPSSVLRSKS
jgi:hypothetical protein